MAVPLGEDEAGMGGDGSRPSRGPRPHRGGSDIPLPAAAPRLPRSVLGPPAAGAGSAATPTEELREMLRFMKSAEWEALASDDQAKYIHEVYVVVAVVLSTPFLSSPPPTTPLPPGTFLALTAGLGSC